MQSISAEQYMTRSPVTVTPETDLFEAIHVMLEKRLTGVTVIDDKGDVVGVLSELDCLEALLDGSYYGEAYGTVGQYMSCDVQVLHNIEEYDLLSVARILVESKRRRIPVVKGKQFAGQVTCRSILQAVKDFSGKHVSSETNPFD